jgi:adenylate cyclase
LDTALLPIRLVNPFPLNFARTLALTMIALVIISASLIGYPMFYRQFTMMDAQFDRTGRTLVQQAATNAIELVFADDELGLGNLVNSFKEQIDVVSVLVINSDLKLIASGPHPPPEVYQRDEFFKHSGVYTDLNNISWFHTPIRFDQVIGGTAWVGLNKAPLIENQRWVLRSALISVCLLVAAIIGLAIGLSRTLSKPISELIEAAQAISAGNFEVRIRNTRVGEFSEVGQAFNQMAQGLAQKLTLEKNFSRFVSAPVAQHYMAQGDAELARHGERVEATIMFVDLVDYTGFSQCHPPEVVAAVLNFYFSDFSTTCHRFNGNVDKFIGDCAMLVFGCPLAIPDHRRHALACAIAIRDQTAQSNNRRRAAGEPTLDIRIGLAGGVVLAGLLGSSERLNYSVIGEAANMAARLCANAPVGGILIDQAFYSALGALGLRTHPVQRIRVKGIHQAVEAFEIETDQPSIQGTWPFIEGNPPC